MSENRRISDYERVSRDQLSVILRVTSRTITRWVSIGLPKNRNGGFSLPEVISWRLEREALAEKKSSSPDEPGQTPEESRYLELFRKERWQLARLERHERQGKLIPAESVQQEWAGRAADLRNTLLAWPNRLGPILSDRSIDDCLEILRKETRALLEAFCREGRYTESQPGINPEGGNRHGRRKSSKPKK